MRGYTIPQLKTALAAVMERYTLAENDGVKIIGYTNREHPENIAAILSGDLSSVPASAAALGIVLASQGIPKKDTKTSKAGTAKKNPKNTRATKSGKNSAGSKKKNPSKQKDNTGDSIQADTIAADSLQDIKTIQADILPADYTPDGLPAGLPETIYSYIEDLCKKDNVTDLKKERQTYWKYICICIGSGIFKKSKILHDIQKEKSHGGTAYDFNKLTTLSTLWGALCLRYNKSPMIDDFANFAGVTDVCLYGTGGGYPDGGGVTPARTSLLKKLHDMQEKGLAGLIVDGRQNPTGALAALNHWHGWTTTREIIHTTGGTAPTPAALPVFDGSSGLLEVKTTDESS